MTAPPKPTCRICTKPAQVWERNEDGTYTHAECAIAESRANGYDTVIKAPKEDTPDEHSR